MELERQNDSRAFKPPATGSTSLSATGKKSDEIPSVKMARLKRELDEIQEELADLAKTEIPNHLDVDYQSSKHQLSTVEELRKLMHTVVESTPFQDLESRK